MILAVTAMLTFAHADVPPALVAVREAVRTWRDCVSDGLDRRRDLTRAGGDVYGLADIILAECRPQQEAAFAARSRWVEDLELSPAAEAVVLRRNERDVRSMNNLILLRARRSAQAIDQGWD